MNGSDFSLQSGPAAASSTPSNNGDPTYIFIQMSDYFGGLNCSSNPGGGNCLLRPNATIAIPYSFVDLPANVIFNLASINSNEQNYETDPSTSTSAVLAGLVGSQGGAATPEPGTLLLVGGCLLTMLRLRGSRRPVSSGKSRRAS